MSEIFIIQWKRSLHNKLVSHNEKHLILIISTKYDNNPASFKGLKLIFSESESTWFSMSAGAAPFSHRTSGQKFKMHENEIYEWNEPVNGKEIYMKTI